MNHTRYRQLQMDVTSTLTEVEYKEGWFFCNFEWDGMLLQAGCPEAEICEANCQCQPINYRRTDFAKNWEYLV